LIDYLKIVENDLFWNHIKQIFIGCKYCLKEFPDLSSSLEGNEISMDLRRRIIKWKYEYSGISSRFMFDLTVKDFTEYFLRVSSMFAPISNICYYWKDYRRYYSSDYILEKYCETLNCMYHSKAIEGTDNQMFQYTLLRMIKERKTYAMKILTDSRKKE
jgi:hypothetical protein